MLLTQSVGSSTLFSIPCDNLSSSFAFISSLMWIGISWVYELLDGSLVKVITESKWKTVSEYHGHAGLDQSVEHETLNLGVEGSSPTLGDS